MQEMQSMVTLTPGAAAAILSVTTQTLRDYERQGKLSPVSRSPGGQRRYALSDIERIRNTVSEPAAPVDPATVESFTGEDTPKDLIGGALDLAHLFKSGK